VTREELLRLRDIGDAIDDIRERQAEAHDAGLGADSPLLRDALLYKLVVIGEAVKNVSEDMRRRRPEVSWKGIAGLRDLLAHGYFRIQMNRIEEIVDQELEPLAEAVRALIADQKS